MKKSEMLFWAASAIGATEFQGIDDCRPPGVALLRGKPTNYEGRGEWGCEWNPLDNDGEALQLAVLLNLQIECMQRQSAARTFDSRFAGCVDHAVSQQYPKRPFNPDPFAATRLAIVIAAVGIGRQGQ